MTFHAYLQYVCLLLVCLCTLPSPMEARVQADRQSTGTRDTLLVIDRENGLPIEGAYILTGERLLVSSPRGMIVFGHERVSWIRSSCSAWVTVPDVCL